MSLLELIGKIKYHGFSEFVLIRILLLLIFIFHLNVSLCKQYRCGVSLYFLSLLTSNFNITIDRMIGALGHGKDIVDAINACDRRYLKEKMCMVGTSEADDCKKIMDAHTMIGEKYLAGW